MLLLELLLFLALAALAVRLVVAARWRGRQVAMALTLLATGIGAALWLARAASGRPPAPIALEHAAEKTVGSGACRSCHPAEYASWHRSFHRTMTQVATPATVLGPWDGVRLESEGRSVELFRRGEELWARLPDPELVAAAIRAGSASPSAAAPLVVRRVLLATGSHHQQVYWVGSERGNELRLLPVSYVMAEKRYVPRRDAFLQPPDAPPHALRWNSNCIQCHATRGEPRLDERLDRFASSATELGIACEACHGPGAEHVRKQHSPLVRWQTELTGALDPTITNPARLAPERASEVCGQCHAYFVPRDEDRWWTAGFADFRPGDDLARTRTLLTPAAGDAVEADIRSLFWGDGTIRVGGRELNGLEDSACFLRGSGKRKLSCLSCHSMHDSEPDDQLRDTSDFDRPCVRCHAKEAARSSEHSHHALGSSGNSCVACHMPFTSYALFKAIRSHRIDSPSAVATARSGRPNACNLCHLDRTLAWTTDALARWYAGSPDAVAKGRGPVDEVVQSALSSTTPRAVEELLAGDAATRAVLAAAFGRHDARRASETTARADLGRVPPWQARPLAELLDDPYAAVRHVACDALRAQRGFGDLLCDSMAEPAARAAKRAEVIARTPSSPLDASIPALLRARDVRPMTISE